MKALTVIQPMASAIAYLGKTHENRNWAVPEWLIGQDLCIHAGKSWDRAYESTIDRIIRQETGKPLSYRLNELPYYETQSAILAVISVSPSVAESGSPWFFGPEGWPTKNNLRVLPQPVPCRGAQGLWDLPPDVEQQVRRQLALVGATK